MSKSEDMDERPEFGRHWGDWGGVVMAFVFLVGFLAFLFSVNLSGLDKADEVLNRVQKENIEKAEAAQNKQAIHDAEQSGVVEVGIAPKKKP